MNFSSVQCELYLCVCIECFSKLLKKGAVKK